MDVLVDTSIWSLALRRSNASPHPATAELAEIIREGRALMLGVIRQELLSGVRNPRQFESLRLHLRAFADIMIDADDYEQAASFCNRCRSKGIQGGAIDFLICAVAARRQVSIFTVDDDFERYAKVLPLTLHHLRE